MSREYLRQGQVRVMDTLRRHLPDPGDPAADEGVAEDVLSSPVVTRREAAASLEEIICSMTASCSTEKLGSSGWSVGPYLDSSNPIQDRETRYRKTKANYGTRKCCLPLDCSHRIWLSHVLTLTATAFARPTMASSLTSVNCHLL